MKLFAGLILLLSMSTFAATKVDCVAGDLKFTVTAVSSNDVRVTFRGETVQADGILSGDEVDLVARFSTIGEMTLFAKVGKVAPENYIFTQGQRNSVVCR